MNQKLFYQAPVLHPIKMEGEGVIAASTQDFGAGKRYDLGQHTPRPLTGGLFRFAKNLLPLLAASLLLLPACSSDDEPQVAPEGGKITLTVTADRGGSSDTRTFHVPGTPNAQGEAGMEVFWNNPPATESIQVIWYDNDVPTVGTETGDEGPGSVTTSTTLTGTAPAANSRSMTFSGEEVTASSGTHMSGYYHYVYPATNNFNLSGGWISYSNYASQTQDCTAGNATNHLQAKDVMYTEQAVAATTDGSGNQTSPLFTFKHAAALIRFDLTLPEVNTLSQIVLRNTGGTPTFGNSIRLTYGTPTATGIAPVTLSSGSLTDAITLDLTNAPTAATLIAYMMTPATSFSSVPFEVRAIASDGTQYIYTGTSGAGDRLEGGVCYTFGPSGGTMTQVPEPVWAGSNIYYDSTLGTLTFAAPGATTPENVDRYQDVFFTYGSIIGVSPYNDGVTTGTSNFNIATSPIFVPDPTTGVYTPTSGSYPTINGTPITNLTGIPKLAASGNDYTNTITADYTAYKGDICAFLAAKGKAPDAGQWRLPTVKEWTILSGFANTYSSTGEWSISQVSGTEYAEANQTDGTAVITDYVTRNAGGIKIPLSGYRSNNPSGTLYYVGNISGYPASNGKRFIPQSNTYGIQAYSTMFMPVRCVKYPD
ncbi:MAG: hypothetical protein LBM06_00755 [Prevotellaceae bacterium]|jgi:hypothetical protein|nr:hypothetical protein [Prevotellaceae bacterium]